jgi:two-component system response regulator YesN
MLIVDDEPLTLQFLARVIPELAPDWIISGKASTGVEALHIMSDSDFDLILTDIKMPEMDGMELCRHIAEQYPEQTVAILSGFDEFAFAQNAIQYGVRDYLLKPIDTEELAAMLRRITIHISKRANMREAVRMLTDAAKNYKTQVIQQYLSAIVGDRQIEIRALHSVVLALSGKELIPPYSVIWFTINPDASCNRISRLDIPIYQMILFETIQKVSVGKQLYPFLVEDACVCACLFGEGTSDGFAQALVLSIQESLPKEFPLSPQAILGDVKYDILDLAESYEEARANHLYFCADNKDNIVPFHQLSLYEKEIINKFLQLQQDIIYFFSTNYALPICEALREYSSIACSQGVNGAAHYGYALIDATKNEKKSTLRFEAQNNLQNSLRKLLAIDQDSVYAAYRDALFILFKNSDMASDSQSKRLAQRAKDYILLHYNEPITLSEVAEKIQISANYLSKIFHDEFGESYIRFLTSVRIENAKKILLRVPYPRVGDVSEMVGYPSVQHFNYVFKKHTGISPGLFQKENTAPESKYYR